MTMINTSQGQKSPQEALLMLHTAQLPDGDLLGIFRGLEGTPQFEGAIEAVVAGSHRYSAKLQRLAREKKTGRPIGAKVMNHLVDVHQFLRQCGLSARVEITIHERQARRLRAILSLNNLKIDDESVRTGLWAVAASGEWQSVPRTFMATLELNSYEVIIATRDAFFEVVEKIELKSTLTERVAAYRAPEPLSGEVLTTLIMNPDLFYERSLFLDVCKDRHFHHQQERVDELSDDSTMEEVLMLFLHNSSREDFLEAYVERFMAALS